MQRYSDFFSTLYDETKASVSFGRGTHYSVMRAVVWDREPAFHDFAVIWDEDHDTRVIWVLEKMLASRLIDRALVVGERKGGITVLTRGPVDPAYAQAVEDIAQSVPSDCFCANVEQMAHATGMLINAETKRVRRYVADIDALWNLGRKPARFTTAPFHDESSAC